MILDLDPQSPHVGIDEARVAEVVVAPHPLEQLLAREHGAGVVGELTQQPELGLRQAQFAPAFKTMPCSRRSSMSPNRVGR